MAAGRCPVLGCFWVATRLVTEDPVCVRVEEEAEEGLEKGWFLWVAAQR
jgi:hypothetical protein